MIISVTPNVLTVSPAQTGGPVAPYYLAGISPATGQYDPRENPNGWDAGREQEEQKVGYFRSPNGATFDRGNLTFSLRFSVTRAFDSLTQAEGFDLMHLAQCPTSGLVTVVLDADQGAYSALYLYSLDGAGDLLGAVVRVKARPEIGVTVIHDYEIHYGQISTTSPV